MTYQAKGAASASSLPIDAHFVALRNYLAPNGQHGAKTQLAKEIAQQAPGISFNTAYNAICAGSPENRRHHTRGGRRMKELVDAMEAVKQARAGKTQPAAEQEEAPSKEALPVFTVDEKTHKWIKLFKERTGHEIHEYMTEFAEDTALLTLRPTPKVGETWVEVPHGRTAIITAAGAFLLTGQKAGQPVEITGAWKPQKKVGD